MAPQINPAQVNLKSVIGPQELSLAEFTKACPWDRNPSLDKAMQSIANQIYSATLPQVGTDEDAVYAALETLSGIASEMHAVVTFLQNISDDPTVSFSVFYAYLKQRVAYHLHEKIFKEAHFFEIGYGLVREHRLIPEILRDEMFTPWVDGAGEEVLNDPYRACMDLWNNGKRTYFAAEDVQKMVGVLKNVDMSSSLNEAPFTTITFTAVAIYTSSVSLVCALGLLGVSAVNSSDQYQAAKTAEAHAKATGDARDVEIANLAKGQAYGSVALTALQAVAVGKMKGPKEGVSTTSLKTPPLGVSERVLVAELDDGVQVFAANQPPQPVAVRFAHPIPPATTKPVIPPEPVTQVAKPSTRVVTPTTTHTPPVEAAHHTSVSPAPTPAASLLPEGGTGAATATLSPVDQAVNDLLNSLPDQPTAVVVAANNATPIRVSAPTPATPNQLMNPWIDPESPQFNPLGLYVDVDAEPDVTYPGDGYRGMSHPDDGLAAAGLGGFASRPPGYVAVKDEGLHLAGSGNGGNVSGEASYKIILTAEHVSLPEDDMEKWRLLRARDAGIIDEIKKCGSTSVVVQYHGVLPELGEQERLEGEVVFPFRAVEMFRLSGVLEAVFIYIVEVDGVPTPLNSIHMKRDQNGGPYEVTIQNITPNTEVQNGSYMFLQNMGDEITQCCTGLKRSLRLPRPNISILTPKDEQVTTIDNILREMGVYDRFEALSSGAAVPSGSFVDILQKALAGQIDTIVDAEFSGLSGVFDVTKPGSIILKTGQKIFVEMGHRIVIMDNVDVDKSNPFFALMGSDSRVPLKVSGYGLDITFKTDEFSGVSVSPKYVEGDLAEPISIQTPAGLLTIPAGAFVRFSSEGVIQIERLTLFHVDGKLQLASSDPSLEKVELKPVGIKKDGSIHGGLIRPFLGANPGTHVAIPTAGNTTFSLGDRYFTEIKVLPGFDTTNMTGLFTFHKGQDSIAVVTPGSISLPSGAEIVLPKDAVFRALRNSTGDHSVTLQLQANEGVINVELKGENISFSADGIEDFVLVGQNGSVKGALTQALSYQTQVGKITLPIGTIITILDDGSISVEGDLKFIYNRNTYITLNEAKINPDGTVQGKLASDFEFLFVGTEIKFKLHPLSTSLNPKSEFRVLALPEGYDSSFH